MKKKGKKKEKNKKATTVEDNKINKTYKWQDQNT